ncbi:putative mitochondrial inheritance component mdm12 protein [Eutypa lata UCREL1]|uniref:Mitochondrial distribution and morphology protein 12 n=1 Tax=Eutypa lata (strain UCR-EL1) TaxID=1287681 RepID=M7T456_EUTLA|nr:putative mitochondrial inheritance component mdm12 protein [Eutypa lata UCREL1]
MSIELNWETLTGGPDGGALAESIRDFIHAKFQTVPLPRFIKSVRVHEFAFGAIPPDVVLKDICDPLPDFYEQSGDEEDDEEDEDGDDDANNDVVGGDGGGGGGSHHHHHHGEAAVGYGVSAGSHGHHSRTTGTAEEFIPDSIRAAERRRRAEQSRRFGVGGGSGSAPPTTSHISGGASYLPPGPTEFPFPPQPHIHAAGLRSGLATPAEFGSAPFLGLGTGTPGVPVPGGTSNMHYLQSKLVGPPGGWSGGAQTPLAAVAGAQHLGAPPGPYPPLREKHSVSTLAPTSTSASRPPTRDRTGGSLFGMAGSKAAIDANAAAAERAKERRDNIDYYRQEGGETEGEGEDDEDSPRRYREPRPEDLQAVFRIRYAGDVRLMLTAEILLDYPMPSFVGIPVKLNITGLTFDGVGVVAYIRKRVHFCFLSPEDAVTALGGEDSEDDDDDEEDRNEGEGDGNGGLGRSSGGGSGVDSERGRARRRDNDGSGRGQSGKGATAAKAKVKAKKGRMGGLLQEIKVESEIGQREGSKQSLKNVGKVERFVLEQVRRIFEEEFVYPSFWTFLV